MSLISVGVAVTFMLVFIPLMTNANRANARANIEESFSELNGNETVYSEEDWEMQMVSFSIAVDNYKRSYSRDMEYLIKHDRYLRILNGFDPDITDPETGEHLYVGTTDRDRRNKALIDTARDEIIDMLGVSLVPPDSAGNILMHVRLENRSEYIINEVRMAFEAFDEFGSPSNGSNSVEYPNQWFVRSTKPLRMNVEESIPFQTAWGDKNISQVKILWMEIEYGPSFSVYLPPAVCEALWR
jgi:hypothetical protein